MAIERIFESIRIKGRWETKKTCENSVRVRKHEFTFEDTRISLYVQCLLQFHFVFHVAARKVTRASKISNMASRRDIVARCCANVTINVQIKKISPIYQKFYLVSVRMDVETLTRCGILRVTEFIISLAYNYIKRRRSSVKRRKVRSPFS